MSSNGSTTTLASCQNNRIVYPSGYIKSSASADGQMTLSTDGNGNPLTNIELSATNSISLNGPVKVIKMNVFNSNKQIVANTFVYLIFEQTDGVITPSYLTQEEWNEYNA